MPKLNYLAAILLSLSTSALFADEPSDTIRLNEVVVSANRVGVARDNAPLSITLISNEDIRNREDANILPLVATITPSVFVSEIGVAGYALGNGTSGQISIRGVSGSPNSRVMMMVDGQPQFMGVFGHPLPNFHMASNVERVEVVRGPASLLYGSNAMGGIINVISKKDKQDGIGISGYGSYGSFNTIKSGAALSYTKDKLNAGVRYNYAKTDGHRDTSAFNISNLHVYAGYHLNENWESNIGFTMASYSFQDPGSIYNASALAFLGDIERNMLTFSVENNYDRSKGGLFAFYNSGHHEFSDGWISDDVNFGTNIFQALELWEKGTLTIGTDIKRYGGIGSSGMNADTLLTVNEVAGYILAEQGVGEWLNLTGGIRLENHSVFGPEWVPQLGISMKPINGTVVKGLVSKGFRSPTIMEMYLFLPNASLGPEEMWNYEASVSQRIGAIGLIRLTGFVIDGSNLITFEPNPNPGPPSIRVNSGEFSNKGIELESSFMPVEDLGIDINYSYLHTETPLLFAPSHQLYTGASYRSGKWRIAASLKSVGGLYTYIDATDAANNVTQSYLLADLKVTFSPIDVMDVYIAGKNLLNQDYQTVYGYPLPGINFMAGMEFDLH